MHRKCQGELLRDGIRKRNFEVVNLCSSLSNKVAQPSERKRVKTSTELPISLLNLLRYKERKQNKKKECRLIMTQFLSDKIYTISRYTIYSCN